MSQTAEAATVTLEMARKLGLLPEEFEKIKEILGRTPNFTELKIPLFEFFSRSSLSLMLK